MGDLLQLSVLLVDTGASLLVMFAILDQRDLALPFLGKRFLRMLQLQARLGQRLARCVNLWYLYCPRMLERAAERAGFTFGEMLPLFVQIAHT